MVAELSPLRGKFGHHDLISLNEDYPFLYRDTCCGLPGLWLVGFVALRPKSTAMVIAGRSVHLTTLFPGQA